MSLNDLTYRNKVTTKIEKYYLETPTASKCLNYLKKRYPFIMPTIDHTAYRFLSCEKYRLFAREMDSDYHLKGYLDFPLKPTDKYHKQAYWYNHQTYSRLFASFIEISKEDEIRIEKLMESNLPRKGKYDQLKSMDQYMAWTVMWGDSINHLALDLSLYPDPFEQIIEEMAQELNLEMNDYHFNNPSPNNPSIAVSQDGFLKQASTKADKVDGIPKAYLEFVSRSVDPREGSRRNGFDTFSANGIFESTG